MPTLERTTPRSLRKGELNVRRGKSTGSRKRKGEEKGGRAPHSSGKEGTKGGKAHSSTGTAEEEIVALGDIQDRERSRVLLGRQGSIGGGNSCSPPAGICKALSKLESNFPIRSPTQEGKGEREEKMIRDF